VGGQPKEEKHVYAENAMTLSVRNKRKHALRTNGNNRSYTHVVNVGNKQHVRSFVPLSVDGEPTDESREQESER
jgi:hypothetical protein